LASIPKPSCFLCSHSLRSSTAIRCCTMIPATPSTIGWRLSSAPITCSAATICANIVQPNYCWVWAVYAMISQRHREPNAGHILPFWQNGSDTVQCAIWLNEDDWTQQALYRPSAAGTKGPRGLAFAAANQLVRADPAHHMPAVGGGCSRGGTARAFCECHWTMHSLLSGHALLSPPTARPSRSTASSGR
jgi:hypothetical protein